MTTITDCDEALRDPFPAPPCVDFKPSGNLGRRMEHHWTLASRPLVNTASITYAQATNNPREYHTMIPFVVIIMIVCSILRRNGWRFRKYVRWLEASPIGPELRSPNGTEDSRDPCDSRSLNQPVEISNLPCEDPSALIHRTIAVSFINVKSPSPYLRTPSPYPRTQHLSHPIHFDSDGLFHRKSPLGRVCYRPRFLQHKAANLLLPDIR